MALPQLPPAVEINSESKKAIIDGLKKVIEIFQSSDLLSQEVTYQDVIHDPQILYGFIQTFREHRELADKIILTKGGKPVTDDDTVLVCGVSLAQVQQLLVKTCARFFLEQDTKQEEEIVTETVTTKRFLFLKKTEQVERKTGGGFDERKVREITRYMAFDWQLPLLSAYAELSSAHFLEIDDAVTALQTPEAVRALAQIDPAVLKKVKQTVGQDFPNILASRPEAINGIAGWNREMYGVYRNALGERAFDFFARDKSFFMVCASLDKPLIRSYGDMLCYIAPENLEEMQRLNIDKTDVLVDAFKGVFGERASDLLSKPAFAKDILRKFVESLLHVTGEKEQLMASTRLTLKAIVPQIAEWLSKQPRT